MSDNYTKRAMVDAGDAFLEEEYDYPEAGDAGEGFHERDWMFASDADREEALAFDDEDDGDEDPYPVWEGETLHVPPNWKGQFSEIEFSSRLEPHGTMVVAEIPGETTSVITALCTDGEGLMDICFGIDAAVGIASEPKSVPHEFLVENSMQLHIAVTIFKEAAKRMDESMDEAFCPPDRTVEFKAQKSANEQGARSLRLAAQRVEAAVAAAASPLLNAASRQTSGILRLH